MSHQDWQPITWTKPSKTQGPARLKPSSDAAKQLRKIESESIKILTVTRAMGQQIQISRQNKNWSQVDLARECNIPVAIVKQYERGEGKYDRKYLDPICRKLGIVLNKPVEQAQEFDQ